MDEGRGPTTSRDVSLIIPETDRGGGWFGGRLGSLAARVPRHTRGVVGLLAGLVVLGVVLVPLALLVRASFVGPRGLTLEVWTRVLSDPSTRGAVWNTVWISAASVALAGVIGIPLALAAGVSRLGSHRVLRWIPVLPGLMPPAVSVLALLVLFSAAGGRPPVFWRSIGFGAGVPALSGGLGVVIAQAYSLYLVFYLGTLLGVRRLDPAQRAVARTLGANPRRVFRTVTLPSVRTFVFGATAIAALWALGSFAAPLLVPDAPTVLPTLIAERWLSGDTTAATVEAVLLAALGIVVLLAVRPILGAFVSEARGLIAVGGGRSAGRWRRTRATIAWTLGLLLLVPVAGLLTASLSGGTGWAAGVGPSGLAGVHYANLMRDSTALGPVWNTARMALFAIGGALFLATVAWVFFSSVRDGGSRRPPIVTVLPAGLAGTVVGIALLSVLGAPRGEGALAGLLGTEWAIVGGWVLRLLPLVVVSGMWLRFGMDPALGDAAVVLGERRVRTVRRLYLGQVFAWATVVALATIGFCLGEIAGTYLLYNHADRPVAIDILDRIGAGQFESAAALGVLVTGLTVLIAAIAMRQAVRVVSREEAAPGRA